MDTPTLATTTMAMTTIIVHQHERGIEGLSTFGPRDLWTQTNKPKRPQFWILGLIRKRLKA